MDEGALEGVLGVHGIHVWPEEAAGTISSKASRPVFPAPSILEA